ncbi:mechanosensitive ion channel domain-containing protein [Trichloromonas sp.]|uniref:mechanosensitive ion channel family protein n=1 Tax=Trichloromonas sp. TaxID=3069249 RepID=UPI002A3D3729|nr:mechanosensitive ion channel [Trichloromonas sp.]
MIFFRLLCLCFLIFPSLTLAQEPAPAPAATAEEQTFPGVAEIIPMASQLSESALKTEAEITPLADLTQIRSEMDSVKVRQDEIMQRLTALGEIEQWTFDRLLEMRGAVENHMGAQRKIIETLSQRIGKLEGIRQAWKEQERFWKDWRKDLHGATAEVPKSAFADSIAQAQEIQERAKEISAPLVDAQNEISTQQNALLDVQNRIEASLNNLRKQTFEKTTHSFISKDFYLQYTPELITTTVAGIRDASKIQWDFLLEKPWVALLQVGTTLLLAFFILRHRKGELINDEWKFMADHPWATGIFVSVISFSYLYGTMPSFWRMGITLLAVLSTAILVTGLVSNPRKRLMLYLLATLFTITQVLQLITFPAPLYRLYLTALCLLGIPVLLLLAKANQNAHEGRKDWFTLILRWGAAILFVSLIAQASGYSNLASRLINSSVGTVFLSLYLLMTLRLAHGAIRYVFSHPVVIRRPFFYRYGDDLIARLSTIVKIFLGAYCFLLLFVVWGIYNSAGQAWDAVTGMSVKVGEMTVSLNMIALFCLVLYFAFTFSWFLRSFLEAQVFPHRDMDRGIRDAIKKLLHYTIIFLGALFAMSLAGVELKSFAFLAGAFGIGIGFGLQNIVNNFVSGIILLFERPVRVGDALVIDGKWSTVRKIGLRSTIVETPDRAEIIVPNSDFISQKVTNWTLSSSIARIVIPVGVAYGSDVGKVLALLTEAANEQELILQNPPPSPIFTAFGASSLDFELRVWVADADSMLGVRSALLQSIDRLFRDAGIEIPFPQQDVHLFVKNGEKPPAAQPPQTETVPPVS